VRELPRGELLRVDGSVVGVGLVRGGVVLVDRGERVLELSLGDLPEQRGSVFVHKLRCRSVSIERRPNELHELSLGQLL